MRSLDFTYLVICIHCRGLQTDLQLVSHELAVSCKPWWCSTDVTYHGLCKRGCCVLADSRCAPLSMYFVDTIMWQAYKSDLFTHTLGVDVLIFFRERHDKRKKELQDRSSQLEGESHRQKQSGAPSLLDQALKMCCCYSLSQLSSCQFQCFRNLCHWNG